MTPSRPSSAWDLLAAAIPRGAAVLAPDADPELVDALAARGCALAPDAADDVAVAVVGRRLDRVDDARQVLKDLAARLRTDGVVLLVAPTATHAALRLGLTDPPPGPEELTRVGAVAWPATTDLLEDAGLHPWWDLPVRSSPLEGTGIEPSAFSPDLLASLESDLSSRATAVVVAAGTGPRPAADGDLVAPLVAEVALLRQALDALDAENRRLGRDADAADALRQRSAELRTQVLGLRAELDAQRGTGTMHEQYIADLERQLDEELDHRRRGFLRLALRLDRWMLEDPRGRRVHAQGGRAIRGLRRVLGR